MAIRFIRQPSDTPNVTNSDDARMVRYAYGGYDGFVLNRGSELSHTINGNIFKINSGVVVLQGYESELDSNGWELDVGSTSRYYSVYYEVNLATQTTAIKSVYNLSSYPDIPASDDLTQSANGIACLPNGMRRRTKAPFLASWFSKRRRPRSGLPICYRQAKQIP